MARALAFYRDVLGLEVLLDHEEKLSAENVPEYMRRAAYLRWPDDTSGFYIVLDTQPRKRPVMPLGLHDTGFHHFAFDVDDLDGIYDRAVGAGCQIMVKPIDIPADEDTNPLGVGYRTTFFHDPDGNLIQLDQRLG
jgi:catechol 2,3-dioxygenase-like lactoylglutathione lyase family enzyme